MPCTSVTMPSVLCYAAVSFSRDNQTVLKLKGWVEPSENFHFLVKENTDIIAAVKYWKSGKVRDRYARSTHTTSDQRSLKYKNTYARASTHMHQNKKKYKGSTQTDNSVLQQCETTNKQGRDAGTLYRKAVSFVWITKNGGWDHARVV